MSLKELQLPSIASLRAIAALKSPHLALVRPARIGLGFESAGASQKTLAEVEAALGGPGRLSLPFSLRWLLDAMTGLGVLHRTLSFVHGEVQPEHVVLGEDGVGRLIPVVRAHWVRGEERAPERLYYLAPEKLLGDRVDVRSDVFSMGVMLWEALTGQRLLEAHAVDDIIARLMGGGIPRAHAPEAEAWTEPLAAIAERAIAVDPGRRFATIGEMKEALQAACSRYLASPPGMAALFQNPRERARTRVRDSIPPESQRATLPPGAQPSAAGSTEPAASNAELAAAFEVAAARRSLASYSSVDLEEETTTSRRGAPAPVASHAQHVRTLLGVPPPFIDRESSPDAITLPFAKIPPSAPVIITPLPVPMLNAAPTLARRSTLSGPPARLTDAVSAPPPASAPVEAPRALPFAPLVAVQPSLTPPAVAEPSFELTRPRKRHGALWFLLLGAIVAIGAFAARPWLARQVAATTSGLPDNAANNADVSTSSHNAAVSTPAAPANSLGAPSGTARLVVGIASTPAMPSRAPVTRGHGGAREEHIVIHDSVDSPVSEPATPAPAEHNEPAAPPAPVTPPTPPTPPPASPAPTPKPKAVPPSDGDRYGI